MAKELGFTPAKGADGGGSYMKGKELHPGAKKRQDGKNHTGKVKAQDHLYNEDGACNGDPEQE